MIIFNTLLLELSVSCDPLHKHYIATKQLSTINYLGLHEYSLVYMKRKVFEYYSIFVSIAISVQSWIN